MKGYFLSFPKLKRGRFVLSFLLFVSFGTQAQYKLNFGLSHPQSVFIKDYLK